MLQPTNERKSRDERVRERRSGVEGKRERAGEGAREGTKSRDPFVRSEEEGGMRLEGKNLTKGAVGTMTEPRKINGPRWLAEGRRRL